jgi:hypothetical protein
VYHCLAVDKHPQKGGKKGGSVSFSRLAASGKEKDFLSRNHEKNHEIFRVFVIAPHQSVNL